MPIRIGIVGLDTSHSQAFPAILHGEMDGKRTYPDVAVTHYFTRGGQEQRAAFLDGLGARRVERPEQMLGEIDAVMIEWVKGAEHLEAARPFAAARLPMFVDKPYAASWADARKLTRLLRKHNCPAQSGSSLRFAPETAQLLEQAEGKGRLITAAFTGPSSGGMYNYGIHAIELMMGALGARHRALGVKWAFNGGRDNDDIVQVGLPDGATATLLMLAGSPTRFSAELRLEKGVVSLPYSNGGGWYRSLMKEVVQFFRTKKPTLPLTATMEVMALIEAANRSKRTGRRVPLSRLD